MLGELAPRYRIGAIEAIGSDPRYPVTDGWPHLVEQLSQRPVRTLRRRQALRAQERRGEENRESARHGAENPIRHESLPDKASIVAPSHV